MSEKLNIHCLQHVTFEGLGCMEEWILENNHNLTYTHLCHNETLPDPDKIDVLIVMGGEMSVHDEVDFPWLKAEKRFIKDVIDANKKVIGICLGAQLISNVLGGTVSKNKDKEIGWFPVEVTAPDLPILKNVPKKLNVFHWHGETFSIPENAIRLFQSEGCLNQGFLYKDHVLGLQFHFEVTPQSMHEMTMAGQNELTDAKYIQSLDTILQTTQFIEQNNRVMFGFLSFLLKV
ncbi:type 1 glutamine amidotransferase [Flavobacterium chilense]|uniref:GMP synthase-Glutamine amidotransferase n=1 Tax=Flavobacterium chilense TaxID=946677 RepID=A0A1M7MTY2_9FLAO|nr:type 1 glutamine amidotransferase [Flavobacterium chilense]SHM94554.1 GMP synthase-Glutamine amidotransferase [Flavobacterium chilense]